MSDLLTLSATARTEFGKGAARRIRAASQIPAVLYGHGSDPQHIVLPGHDTMMALKHQNALLTIDVEGESLMAIAKDVQRDPIKPVIVHVDLLLVRKGEKITVEVPVHLEGESAPGTMHVLENSSVQVLAEATNLPEFITVSLEGLEEGDRRLAGDLDLPTGSELAGDPEQLIVQIEVPRQGAESDVEAGEAAEQAAVQPASPADED